eukprot:gnl/Dysnectes_brevis/266_a297_8604.p1 GENE.gnl/Dysnectes_brevis/266_a297_8604~~gnl/Dysnectes_brevis/266_a297_8604.p1  ORF type:complete len:251 (+),score=52.25 gnl/Dysnectes_brevis/266_a297_8604:67-819(+)
MILRLFTTLVNLSHLSYSTMSKFLLICMLALFSIALSSDWYDYLVFTTFYPGGACDPYDRRYGNCAIPDCVSGFTMHGNWPSRLSCNGYPSYCTSEDYSSSDASYYQNDLDCKWPDYTHGDDYLVSHEYEKHGTCAEDIPALATQDLYLTGSMAILDSFQIQETFDDLGYVANDDKAIMDLDTVLEELKDVYGKTVTLQCNKYSGNKYVFSQLHFCLNKTLDLIDCPSCKTTDDYEDCGSGKYDLWYYTY